MSQAGITESERRLAEDILRNVAWLEDKAAHSQKDAREEIEEIILRNRDIDIVELQRQLIDSDSRLNVMQMQYEEAEVRARDLGMGRGPSLTPLVVAVVFVMLVFIGTTVLHVWKLDAVERRLENLERQK